MEKVKEKTKKEKLNGFIGEFKKFILRGNVLDLAVGVIIGGAFGKIVTSLVNDILMPIIGLFLGGLDFSTLSINNIKYGSFIQQIVDFIIVAFCVFVFVKLINNLFKAKDKKEEIPVVKKTDEVLLLEEIRDLLKKNKK